MSNLNEAEELVSVVQKYYPKYAGDCDFRMGHRDIYVTVTCGANGLPSTAVIEVAGTPVRFTMVVAVRGVESGHSRSIIINGHVPHDSVRLDEMGRIILENLEGWGLMVYDKVADREVPQWKVFAASKDAKVSELPSFLS